MQLFSLVITAEEKRRKLVYYNTIRRERKYYLVFDVAYTPALANDFFLKKRLTIGMERSAMYTIAAIIT